MFRRPEPRARLGGSPRRGALAVSTVLVVDDEPGVRGVIAMLLADEGHRVLEAEDGRRALELARQARPMLVVLDLTMPELDGFAVCRALRADDQLASMRVLILSGHGDEADKDLAERMGADAYLTKPFTSLGLVEVVRQLTDGEREAYRPSD
jgi:DNA-binding response OmpR family regulator